MHYVALESSADIGAGNWRKGSSTVAKDKQRIYKVSEMNYLRLV